MRIPLVIFLALLAVPAASASGPWLGTTPEGIGYSAVTYGDTTTIGDGTRSISAHGKWGIPLVTMNGDAGGLTTDGRVLVLGNAGADHPNGALSRKSSFLVLGTKPLHVVRTVTLRGDFGFDTLSPDGRTLYLIQHVSQRELLRYQVRAYDLGAGRLLSRVIADKRQSDWLMTGMPVARAATPDGRWVYTLYQQGDNYPFVHALDSVGKTAVCVGLPWAWTGSAADAVMRADLHVDGGKLVIAGNHGKGARLLLNTHTLKLVRS
jgi:hypothetical protein